ncbi:glutamate synthase [NADH], partial [Coemansia sp. Cherry 401B]
YSISATRFVGDEQGRVVAIETVRVAWAKDSSGKWTMSEVPGSEERHEADLVLLAMGFLGPESRVLEQLDVKQGARSNVQTPEGSYRTSVDRVFAAGDCRRGQSLVVWGINEGRQAAREIDMYLAKSSRLPVSGGIVPRTVSVLPADVAPQVPA